MARRQPYHYGSGVNGVNGNGSQFSNEDFLSSTNPDQHEDNSFVGNDYLVDGLRSKVTVLKSLTLDMGDEIKSQNRLLGEMDNEFDTTWGFLSSSMVRVKKLASSGHNRLYVYLMFFSLFVFFFIYMIIRFR